MQFANCANYDQTDQGHDTNRNDQTNRSDQTNIYRILEGWCENCQTREIANIQFRSARYIQSSVQEMLANIKT